MKINCDNIKFKLLIVGKIGQKSKSLKGRNFDTLCAASEYNDNIL